MAIEFNFMAKNKLENTYGSHVRWSLAKLLDVLRVHNTNVTFFITGSFYQQFPELIRSIHENGHEVAYHSHSHRHIETKEILLKELADSATFIREYSPRGFRAPYIYLPNGLLQVLRSHGFVYDSSTFASPGKRFEKDDMQIFPVSSISYSWNRRSFPIYPKRLESRMFLREIPLGCGIMVSWLRKSYSNILQWYARRGISFIFYLHLWQLFPPPDLKFDSWTDKVLCYPCKFPLVDVLQYFLSQNSFHRMDDLLCVPSLKTAAVAHHFLTLDLE
jgi:hypothetical protein